MIYVNPCEANNTMHEEMHYTSEEPSIYMVNYAPLMKRDTTK